MDSKVLILDNGAYTEKVGYNTQNEPRLIPNCITKAKSERQRSFIGDQIDDCKDVSGLFYILPFQKGYLMNWDVEKQVWDYTFGREVFKVDYKETALIVSEPYFNFPSIQENMTEIMFEEYGFKALYRTNPAVLSHYKYLQTEHLTSPQKAVLVIDSGYSFTHLVPFIKNKIYKPGIKRIDVGGKALTNHLKDIISYRQLHVMDETYVMNQVKEDVCYVSTSFWQDMEIAKKRGADNIIVRDYVLPDYTVIKRGYVKEESGKPAAENEQVIRMNNERFTVPELLFHPSDVGLRQMGISEAVLEVMAATPEATKIKLEEIMEIAEKQKIQIIALQETKLNEKYNLKYKNYNILRKDRNKEGGGLAFLIKNLYYEDIAITIPNTSDLEAQEISTKTKTSSIKEKFWNFKKANWNLYQQNTNEDFRKAPTRIKDLEQNWISFKNTIIKAAKVSIPRENTDLNKTPGPDGIHGQMISNLGKNGKERLLDIFNNSWKTGKLPQDWKTATIIPIKKLDKSADDPKNYRPISLTKVHPYLLSNIVLTGGCCSFPGFKERLETDVRALAPDIYEIQVTLPDNPLSYAWSGGRALSKSPQFQKVLVTKSQYEENGLAFCLEKFDKAEHCDAPAEHKDQETSLDIPQRHGVALGRLRLGGTELFPQDNVPHPLVQQSGFYQPLDTGETSYSTFNTNVYHSRFILYFRQLTHGRSIRCRSEDPRVQAMEKSVVKKWSCDMRNWLKPYLEAAPCSFMAGAMKA
ncbi:ACTR6 [Cordylochernes scorpioides]|uniref:ACTR6 n=1 Tax=Cordylochernes scorpioides TaxID=51811 RepID=A0ABY6LA28_9ARAC|nr:ACTR6 [Cordylochernes scorpioides]